MMAPKEREEVIAAYLAGAAIEMRNHDSTTGAWVKATAPQWKFEYRDYRVAPKPEPPIPDEAPRHNTYDEMIAVIEAEKAGQVIEFRPADPNDGYEAAHWRERYRAHLGFNFSYYQYRAKPLPPEEPKPFECYVSVDTTTFGNAYSVSFAEGPMFRGDRSKLIKMRAIAREEANPMKD